MKGLTVKEDSGVLSAYISCELDHNAARSIREAIDAELIIKKPKVLRIDFSDVTFMDSSGIGLIIGRADKAAALGGDVEICGLSPRLRRLVRMSGVEKLRNLKIT